MKLLLAVRTLTPASAYEQARRHRLHPYRVAPMTDALTFVEADGPHAAALAWQMERGERAAREGDLIWFTDRPEEEEE